MKEEQDQTDSKYIPEKLIKDPCLSNATFQASPTSYQWDAI